MDTTSILSLGPAAALYLLALMAVAAFARGYSGFGAPALLVTGGSLVAAPQKLVPLVLLLDVIASVVQLRGVLSDIAWRRLWLLLLSSAVGTPLGVQALRHFDPDAARVVVAVYVVTISVALLWGWRLTRLVGDAGMLVLGFLCGFVTGLIAMGGMVVVTFLTADGTKPAALRATLIAYFLPLDGFAVLLFMREGAYDADGLTAVAIAVPILLVGIWLGGRHFLSASPEQFRRYTLGFLIVLAMAAFVRALLG
ncbi:MAG: TSUP family transporter [Hyphomicrobiaceae bacterium]